MQLSSGNSWESAFTAAAAHLLSEREPDGVWVGELSTSALSTATAAMALEMVSRALPQRRTELQPYIARALHYLATHQNTDGGWGDTEKSFSNISTSMLAYATLQAADTSGAYAVHQTRAKAYIDREGGVAAVRARYGKDRTFSVPILTHCALAGLVDWREVTPLPFELACIPARFYKYVQLPVVSYALPALIAIGQARFVHRKPRNPWTWFIRTVTRQPALAVLQSVQPESGGFLEAAPLTSFVTMSLASIGLADHPVAEKGVAFLLDTVRSDGSWPIDTNLRSWVTSLSVQALGSELPADAKADVYQYLIERQYKLVHPYTQADPGGWAWTDLSGGVPDADDTPAALLALASLDESDPPAAATERAAVAGICWLLNLQNRDGGWPTFCRGWGYLPFDRSSADLTAHALRAFETWRTRFASNHPLVERMDEATDRGLRYLAKVQRGDGSWLPLWFGNQHAPDDENPTYGTARCLAAFRDLRQWDREPVRRGCQWLREAQNRDGGWGAGTGTPSSVEETALAVEILLDDPEAKPMVESGLGWLASRVADGTFTESTPIGFYFAKLWYFEKLYPIIFTVGALRRACEKNRKGDRLVDRFGATAGRSTGQA